MTDTQCRRVRTCLPFRNRNFQLFQSCENRSMAMASAECSLMLSQCINIVHHLTSLNQYASISVRIGVDFDFSFTNQESIATRKLSPSQQQRNRLRRVNYQQSKSACQVLESKLENGQSDVDTKQDLVTNVTPTEAIDMKEAESQTDIITVKDAEVNTAEKEIMKLDSVLDVNENGAIEPRNSNEKVMEIRISHDFKTWEEIQLYIKEKVGMTFIGRPWLANNGNHFMTVGFRTSVEDYEAWKIRTFNWQEASMRAVSSSRLYR